MAQLRNFRRDILVAAVSQQPQTKRQLRAIAAAIRDDARSNAPMRTGRLRRSIKVQNVYDRATRTVEYRISWDRDMAFYGPMVEQGTSRSRPRPHLRPAARKHGGD